MVTDPYTQELRGPARLLHALGLIFVARAMRQIGRELSVLGRHWQGTWKARTYRGRKDLKLQFACGPNARPGWVNIDLGPGADLRLDLRKRLPFDDESCQMTMSEHFLEHLDFPYDALQFLRECFRVTRRDGVISVGVPDAGGLMLRYAHSRTHPSAEPLPQRPWYPPWVDSWMARVNFCFRQNYAYYAPEHRYAYDLDTLSKALAIAGFTEVRQRAGDPETDSAARMDSTLYVEARRP